jgi:predicted  nucleic acid-binding Zn-ribbon protein
MTVEQIQIWERISKYAEEVLGDIDPQKTKISTQLEALKPVMEQISKEKNMTLEDVFILYMDLASQAGVQAEANLKSELEEDGMNGFSNIANSLK